MGGAPVRIRVRYAKVGKVRFLSHRDLARIIDEEKLKPALTEKFIDGSFRDGSLKTTGTDIDKILPAVSRFGNGARSAKKQTVIEKLLAFFEKYLGLV